MRHTFQAQHPLLPRMASASSHAVGDGIPPSDRYGWSVPSTISSSPLRPLPTSLAVTGLLLVASNLRAAITGVGPVLEEIEASLGIPSSAASILVSLPLLAFALVSPVAPRVARALGLERTIGLALAVLAVGLVLRSVPPDVLLWVGTALIGAAIAVLNVLLPSLVKRDFPRKVGELTGAYSAVQSAFAAIAAGVAVPVAGATALGWRLPVGMWAGLALVGLAAIVPQIRRSPAPEGAAASTTPTSAPTDPATPAGTPPRRPHHNPWRSALAWQVTAFMGLQSASFYILVTWLPSMETSAGISPTAAGVNQFLLNALGILGSLICSALIARLRDQRALAVAGALLLLVGTGGMLLLPSAAALWSMIAGFGGGGTLVLALSLFGLRTTDHVQAASLSGMAQGVGYLLAAVGPIAIGALHDVEGSWTCALVVLGLIDVAILVAGALAGRDRVLS
jgi:CP family cyanate transporter-like MFS transporter